MYEMDEKIALKTVQTMCCTYYAADEEACEMCKHWTKTNTRRRRRQNRDYTRNNATL